MPLVDGLLEVGLGVFLGFVFALLGAGGGVLAVPGLLFISGMSMTKAIGTSAGVVFLSAAAGGVQHVRLGNVVWKVAIPFGIAAVLGSLAGANVAPLIPTRVTTLLFAGLLVVISVRMMAAPPAEVAPTRREWPLTLPLGAFAGFLTGLLGVGGGFVIVPVISRFLGLPMKQAVGTSLTIAVLSTLAATATYAARGDVDASSLLAVGAGGVVGAVLGARVVGKIADRTVRFGFAALAGTIAVRMLFLGFTTP